MSRKPARGPSHKAKKDGERAPRGPSPTDILRGAILAWMKGESPADAFKRFVQTGKFTWPEEPAQPHVTGAELVVAFSSHKDNIYRSLFELSALGELKSMEAIRTCVGPSGRRKNLRVILYALPGTPYPVTHAPKRKPKLTPEQWAERRANRKGKPSQPEQSQSNRPRPDRDAPLTTTALVGLPVRDAATYALADVMAMAFGGRAAPVVRKDGRW